jgi:hypothetical protein
MRKLIVVVCTSAFMTAPQLAAGQEDAAVRAVTEAASHAPVGGPMGAALNPEQTTGEQAGSQIMASPVVATTGSIRQRTCSVDIRGNQSCTEVVR